MEENIFILKESDNNFTLQKSNQVIKIWQSSDNDIWFETKEEKAEIELDSRSSKIYEFQLYAVFERLMKSIIGRYMLKDIKNPCSSLPEDFINLENMTILWHSDGSTNNTLKIVYTGNTIKVSIIKDKDAKVSKNNRIRIRTSGSDYGTYYQEFIRLLEDIKSLNFILNIAKEKQTTTPDSEPVPPPRKLSLKRLFHSRNNN